METQETKINESILDSIKKLLGITADNTDFDEMIIMHINTAFTNLLQLGIGPMTGYKISSKDNKWSEFLSAYDQLESVKTYVYLKTKVVFDPPLNSSVLESFNANIKELEFRLDVMGEKNRIGGV